MKSNILGLVAVLGLLAGPAAFANSGEFKVDEWMDKMKAELSLNDQQVQELKPVMDNYNEKLTAAKKEKEDKIDLILNPEQKSKLKEYKETKDAMELPK